MKKKSCYSLIKLFCLILFVGLLASCGGGKKGGNVGDGVVELKAIYLQYDSNYVFNDEVSDIQADGLYSDGTVKNITDIVEWHSSNPEVASVQPGGHLIGHSLEGVTITASYQGVSSKSLALQVVELSPVAVTINLPNAVLAQGTTSQATAQVTYQNGKIKDNTNFVNWISSNPNVATVESDGTILAKSAGDVVISAEFKGVASNNLNVHVTQATLKALEISIDNNVLPINIKTKIQAIGEFTDGRHQDLTNQVTWYISQASIATIDGKTGEILANSSGKTTISATYNGVNSLPINLEVKDEKVVLVKLAIEAPSNVLTMNEKTSLKALGFYSDGSEIDLSSSVLWSSTDQSIIGVKSDNGVMYAHANGVGVSQVTATYANLDSNTINFTVKQQDVKLERIEVSFNNNDLPIGITAQSKAHAYYSDGTNRDITNEVIWSSSDNSIANIDANGLITAIKNGQVSITASFNDVSGAATLIVVDTTPKLKSISIAIQDGDLPVGAKTELIATGHYEDVLGNKSTENLTSMVNWMVSDDTIANVDKLGIVTANKLGNTVVTASFNGVDSNGVTINVTDAQLVSLNLTLDNHDIVQGTHSKLQVFGRYSDNSEQDLTNFVKFNYDNSIINIYGGKIEGVKAGKTQINAEYGKVSSNQLEVNVANPQLQHIVINVSDNNLPAGFATTVSAIGYYDNGSSQDLTNDVAWVVSDKSIADFTNTTTLQSYKAGNATLSATYNKVTSNSVEFKVVNAKLQSIGIIFSANNIPLGLDVSANAEGFFSDGTKKDITKDVSWHTTDGTIVNVSFDGKIETRKAGQVKIHATLDDIKSEEKVLLVNDAVLKSIQISSSTTILPIGVNTEVKAVGIYSDNSQKDITTDVDWLSSDNSKLNITKNGVVQGVAVGNADITASLSSIASNKISFTVDKAVLKSIVINVGDTNLPAGTNLQFSANGIYSDNSTQDLTKQVSWLSSSTTTANINSNGLLTANQVGNTVVSAKFGDITSNSQNISVTAAKLQSITVTLDANNIPAGTNTFAKARGHYSDGSTKDLTNEVIWSSASDAVANIDTNGNIKDTTKGQTQITATYASISSTPVLLTITDATLVSLSINVDDSNLIAGYSTKVIAMGTYTDGSIKDVSSLVTWTSSSPSTVVIYNMTSLIFAKGLKVGSASIYASLSGKNSNSIQISVTQAVLTSIDVSVPDTFVRVGETNQASATGYYSDGTSQNLTNQVAWKTFNADDGRITITQDGKYTVNKTYSWFASSGIYAEKSGVKSNEVDISQSVNPMKGLAISVDDNNIAAGTQTQLRAILIKQDGKQYNLSPGSVDWSSSSPSTININSDGVITAYKAGTVEINASYDSFFEFGSRVNANPITITVSGRALEKITINMSSTTLASGTSTNAVATGWYYDNTSQDLTNQVTWVSSDTTVANVSANGTVKGNKAGNTQISAKFNNINSNTLGVSVTPAHLTSMTLSLVSYNLAAGISTDATVIGTYSDGSIQNITNQVSFVSSDPAVANVNSSGQLQTYKPGSIVLQAKYGTNIVSNQVDVTVSLALLSSITISPNQVQLAKGTNLPLSATGKYTDGSTQDLTNQVIWTSSNDAIASFNTGGVIVANALGDATLQAKYGSITSSSINVNVTAATISSIKVDLTNSTLSAGKTTTAKATGVYTDGSTQDLTNQVSWTSSDNSIANVDASGKIFGEKAGVATITAEYGQFKASANIQVNGNYLKSMKLEIDSTNITLNVPIGYKVIGTYSDGSTQDITGDTRLTSDNGSIDYNNSKKLFYIYKVGTYNIYADYNLSSNLTSNKVTVNASEATLVSVEKVEVPANISVGEYGFGTIKASGKFSDGSVKGINSNLNWKVSDENIAVVTYSGSFVVGLKVGTVTVTASYGSWSQSFTVNVGEALPMGLKLEFKSSYPYNTYDQSLNQFTIKPNINQWYKLFVKYTDGNQVELDPNNSYVKSGNIELDYDISFGRPDLFSTVCEDSMKCYIYSATNYATSGMFLKGGYRYKGNYYQLNPNLYTIKTSTSF